MPDGSPAFAAGVNQLNAGIGAAADGAGQLAVGSSCLLYTSVVRRFYNTEDRRIAHIEVGRTHIDFRAQYFFSLRKFARFHTAEQIQILFDAALPIRAFPARLRERSTVFAHLLRR